MQFTSDGHDYTATFETSTFGYEVTVKDANDEECGSAFVNHMDDSITYVHEPGENGSLNYYEFCDDKLNDESALAIARWIAGTYWQ